MHGAGAGAMFRAHEVAHQWWGHLVGPATYRDAWLSESLAEYSAMMFVESTMKDAGKTFREVLRADSDELTGSLQSGYSEFSNPAINLLNRSKGERIGPIGLGWRASPGEVPTAYSSLVYSKGPLVLHMLRSLLRDTTHSDQTSSTSCATSPAPGAAATPPPPTSPPPWPVTLPATGAGSSTNGSSARPSLRTVGAPP
jgi:hypothetical protein